MDSTRLPPQTPRRQLLKRIHRRSSILPSIDPLSQPQPCSSTSTSTSTTRSSSKLTSINAHNTSPLLVSMALEKHDEAEEDYERTKWNVRETQFQHQTQPADHKVMNTDHDHYNSEDGADENGEEAAWAQVDELMDTVQLKDQRILELEKTVSSLQRDLRGSKSSKSSNPISSDGGLTRAAAIKLEREFLSQEMILKGLQRDNEDKTLEVEALRRKVKIMSDFLARQYGADDWEAVVSAASGTIVGSGSIKETRAAAPGSPEKEALSAVAKVLGAVNVSPRAGGRAKLTPILGSDAEANPFSPAMASPTKALNNDDVLIPTIARMQTPSSSPSKLLVSSFTTRRTSMDHADHLADQEADQEAEREPCPLILPDEVTSRPSVPLAGVDPNVLLSSIESVRLLMQGFERKNAMRRAELEATIERAIQAERRAESLQASASSAVTTSLPKPASITAS
ncbi:uncharacterized protein MEPE_01431 [Melanopsichium pennsylvanicum]|uniref:Uncharacterized protein n=2 Tax=Melanopsichium pennsylvanicum TaxID=63383 RepID=A0AAJ5C3L2_9BASI|nr:hypothetical protein BN887_05820 [Melanopsichium pennsylvanicum 4]SNX82725.1 uncharacterized protein MEPE_01431 [Melanopsichium pennsylvanicum]